MQKIAVYRAQIVLRCRRIQAVQRRRRVRTHLCHYLPVRAWRRRPSKLASLRWT